MVVAGTGTGGTISGIGRKMKEKCPKCQVGIVYFITSRSRDFQEVSRLFEVVVENARFEICLVEGSHRYDVITVRKYGKFKYIPFLIPERI